MKGFFVNLWNNFKNQPDIWFFFGFLLTFTLSIRKVLLHFPIQGTFNEYCATYIYLSDIFLILTFIFWLISILRNISLSLSSIKLWINSATHKLYIFLPLFLVFLSFISILWSQNVSIAIFRSFKLLEFYLLYLYIIFRIVPRGTKHTSPNPSPYKGEGGSEDSMSTQIRNVPRGTIETPFSLLRRRDGDEVAGVKTAWLFWIIILSGLFQAIIGIIQFFLQKSIGLFWLRESLISPEILGVAKIILNRETYIRSYGLMPHPNVLGGFLLFSIIITLLYNKLFHACPPEKCSTWNNFGRVEQFWAGGTIWTFRLILALQVLALILTFSKSAIIGIIIALVYILTPFSFIGRRAGDEVYDCSTWNNSQIHLTQTLSLLRREWLKLFHVEHLKLIVLSTLVILFSIFIIIKPNFDSLFLNSLNERLFYLNVPRGTFESDPFFGLGAGQSVLSMQKYFAQTLEFWQYQPVHNVFLLIFSELGLIELGLFIWWLWKLFHVEQNTPHPNPLLVKEREQIVPRGTISNTPFSLIRRRDGDEVAGSQNEENNNNYILHNDNTYLSSIIITRYFTGILLGLIFIMLFDHYLWDIQQGSLLFWLTAGFVAGINRKYQRKRGVHKMHSPKV